MINDEDLVFNPLEEILTSMKKGRTQINGLVRDLKNARKDFSEINNICNKDDTVLQEKINVIGNKIQDLSKQNVEFKSHLIQVETTFNKGIEIILILQILFALIVVFSFINSIINEVSL